MQSEAVYWVILAAGTIWAAFAPVKLREGGLALAAFTLVALHNPLVSMCYLALVALTWSHLRHGREKSTAATTLIVALAVGLAFCQWLEVWWNDRWHSPLGLSYLVFRLIHALVDARRGAWKQAPGFMEFVHFMLSPALFVAGPLERWAHWQQQPSEPAGRRVAEGVWRLLIGFLKKLYIADLLLPEVVQRLHWLAPEQAGIGHSPGELWEVCLFVYLKIYVEFSGYSDIAVGAGLLWGRRPMENFNWPILAANPSDFWRRWHISIAQWCADCVYLPLMGRLRNVVVPMLASFTVMGLWHGLGWNRVGWAVWQVMGLLIFITWQKRLGRPKPRSWRAGWPWQIASVALTQAFVVASYAFMLRGELTPVGESFALIARMLGWSP